MFEFEVVRLVVEGLVLVALVGIGFQLRNLNRAQAEALKRFGGDR